MKGEARDVGSEEPLVELRSLVGHMQEIFDVVAPLGITRCERIQLPLAPFHIFVLSQHKKN